MKKLISIIVIVCLSTVSKVVPAGLINIGSDKQLFIGPWAKDGRDAHLVASMKNITMTMHEAIPTGERLFELDRPWEGKWIVDMRFTVLRDQDRVVM